MSGRGIAYINPPRDAAELLRRAAFLAAFYSRGAEGLAQNPDTATFTFSGLLERANCTRVKGHLYMNRGRAEVLADAKAVLCRRLRAVHLDAWELVNKPSGGQIRRALGQA